MIRLKIAWGLVSIVLFLALINLHDYTHFTWWSLTAFFGYAISGTLSIEYLFFWYFVSIQANVITGVLAMSFIGRCRLLQDAADINGPFVYITGNFVMHYAGLLMAIALISPKKLQLVRRHTLGCIFSAYGLFLAYTNAFSATSVYGCDLDRRWVTVGSLLTSLLTATTATFLGY